MAVFPFVSLTNQWTDGEEINAAKMFARVDTQLNALATASFNPPRFKGVFSGTVTITGTSPIPYPVVQDTASGWSVGTSKYTIPLAGTYLVINACKWGTSPGSTNVTLYRNGTAAIISPNAPNTTFTGPQMVSAYQFALGDVVWMQIGLTYTTQNDGGDNNYFILSWTGI